MAVAPAPAPAPAPGGGGGPEGADPEVVELLEGLGRQLARPVVHVDARGAGPAGKGARDAAGLPAAATGAERPGFLATVDDFVTKTGKSLGQMEHSLLMFAKAQAPPLYTAGPGAVIDAIDTIRAFRGECTKYTKFIQVLAAKLVDADLRRQEAARATARALRAAGGVQARHEEAKRALARQLVDQVKVEVGKLKAHHQKELRDARVRESNLGQQVQVAMARLESQRLDMQKEFSLKLKQELQQVGEAARHRQRDAVVRLRVEEEAKRSSVVLEYEKQLKTLKSMFSDEAAQEGSAKTALEGWVKLEKAKYRALEFRLEKERARAGLRLALAGWKELALRGRVREEIETNEELYADLQKLKREQHLMRERSEIQELKLREEKAQYKVGYLNQLEDERQKHARAEREREAQRQEREAEARSRAQREALQEKTEFASNFVRREHDFRAQQDVLESQLASQMEMCRALNHNLLETQQELEKAEEKRSQAHRRAEDLRLAAEMAEKKTSTALHERDVALQQMDELRATTENLSLQVKKLTDELHFLRLQKFQSLNEPSPEPSLCCSPLTSPRRTKSARD